MRKVPGSAKQVTMHLQRMWGKKKFGKKLKILSTMVIDAEALKLKFTKQKIGKLISL